MSCPLFRGHASTRAGAFDAASYSETDAARVPVATVPRMTDSEGLQILLVREDGRVRMQGVLSVSLSGSRTHSNSRSMNYRRRLHLASGFVLLLAVVSAQPAASQDRPTVTVTVDRNGRLDPRQPAPSLRAPLDIRFEYRASQIFDLSVIDAPLRKHLADLDLQPDIAFMLYPEDNAVRFGGPIASMNSLPPGNSSFYFMGRPSIRLRFTMLSEDAVNPLMSADTKDNYAKFLVTILKRVIPEAQFVAAGQARDAGLEGSGAFEALARAGQDTAASTRLSLMRVDVNVPTPGEQPFMLIELGQDQLNGNFEVVYASLARVVTEAEPVFLETRGAKRMRIGTSTADGILSATVADAPAGVLEAQFCAVPAQKSRLAALRGVGSEHCVPLSPLKLRVEEVLPSRVRYQPGIIVADRGREPRLAAHMVFVRDPAGYYEKRGWRSWPSGINPTAGIQLGGSESILVLLLGLHVRLVPEAGVVGGFRFGNENTNSGWWAARESYFGISLDPALFNKLRPSK